MMTESASVIACIRRASSKFNMTATSRSIPGKVDHRLEAAKEPHSHIVRATLGCEAVNARVRDDLEDEVGLPDGVASKHRTLMLAILRDFPG